jgi:hypothetical protein
MHRERDRWQIWDISHEGTQAQDFAVKLENCPEDISLGELFMLCANKWDIWVLWWHTFNDRQTFGIQFPLPNLTRSLLFNVHEKTSHSNRIPRRWWLKMMPGETREYKWDVSRLLPFFNSKSENPHWKIELSGSKREPCKKNMRKRQKDSVNRPVVLLSILEFQIKIPSLWDLKTDCDPLSGCNSRSIVDRRIAFSFSTPFFKLETRDRWNMKSLRRICFESPDSHAVNQNEMESEESQVIRKIIHW